MDDDEMVRTFTKTQKAPYYVQVIKSLGKPFVDIIKKGDLVDVGIQSGKIEDFSTLKVMADHFTSGNYVSSSKKKL